jgi:ABC-type polysaccharide/polyol phosphate export permease
MLTILRSDLRDMVQELVEYRELLYSMVWRDLLLRYKQTVMGFGWAILMPVLYTIVFSMVFMRVAPLDTGMPYPLFAFSGLFAWNLLASSLRFSIGSLTSHMQLITKVYFPREIFPFATIVVSLVDFGVGLLVVLGLITYYGITPGWTVLFLPVVIVVQVAFTAGCALLLALGNLFYRDVKYFFELVLLAWMFATSVLYPIEHLGGRLASVLGLNPMTPIIDAYRSVLIRGELPPAGPFAAAALVSVVLLLASWVLFHRTEFRFAEVI